MTGTTGPISHLRDRRRLADFCPSPPTALDRLCSPSGYSEDAIRHKVKNGTWAQGRIWRKARDNRVFINIEELDRWVESSPQKAA